VGSGRIVGCASKLAYGLNLSKIHIGAAIIAFITALPELVTSILAVTYGGSSHMALGNIIGSNIYNIPMVIGICALARRKLNVDSDALRRESSVLLTLSTMLICILFITHRLTSWISCIFLVGYPIYLYRSMKSSSRDEYLANGSGTYRYGAIKDLAITIVYGLILLLGAYILVHGVLIIADILGLSYLYAGMNILSLGCIIPEIAVSILAAFKDEHDIALGNVIGDNIITITLVLGVVGLIAQPDVTVTDIVFTMPFMNFSTILALIASRYSRDIGRIHGLIIVMLAIALYILETILVA